MPDVRITFLGTGAGNCIYRAHTAIALDCPDGTRILLDTGSGNSALVNGSKLGIFAQDFHQVLLISNFELRTTHFRIGLNSLL